MNFHCTCSYKADLQGKTAQTSDHSFPFDHQKLKNLIGLKIGCFEPVLCFSIVIFTTGCLKVHMEGQSWKNFKKRDFI